MTEITRAIIGGGLAGLSLADALNVRGDDASSVTMIDGSDSRRGSSVPATMLHPFPGRKMNLRRGQGDAFVRSWRRLQAWDEAAEVTLCRPAPMIRPIGADERSQLLRTSWQQARQEYPALIDCAEIGSDELRRRFPGIEVPSSALVYTPAAAVALPTLVRSLSASLKSRGVTWIDQSAYAMERCDGRWQVDFEDGQTRAYDQVILAIGARLDVVFPNLDLRRRAGEVAVFDPGGRQLPALINGRKHLLQRPDGRWGLGSTYFRPDQWYSRDDEHILEVLRAGIRRVVPAIDECETVQLWRAVRGVFGSDHMPLVGPVPGQQALFVMGAFGSKGLLWAPSAGDDLARHLRDGSPSISPHMDTRRMSPERWCRPDGDRIEFARLPTLG